MISSVTRSSVGCVPIRDSGRIQEKNQQGRCCHKLKGMAGNEFPISGMRLLPYHFRAFSCISKLHFIAVVSQKVQFHVKLLFFGKK